MADGKIKISELDEALQLSDNAEFPYTQDNGGVPTTFKAPANQIARKVAEGSTFTNLTTTAKTLVGAINELKALGSPILLGTTAPTAQQGADGNIYVQYTEGTGGASDTVDSIYAKIDGAWCEIETGGGGGSGGHTIVDDSGTSLTQRTNLQFNGAYSEDNATDDTTEIDVVREMTKAEFDQLTEAEKTGLINITDITGGNDDRFQPVLFSENEQEIGVWVDGKPLYQKSFIFTSSLTITDNWTSTTYTIADIDNIADGIIWRVDCKGSIYIDTNVQGSTIYISTKSKNSTFGVGSVLTIRYTKTSDVAGSGTWTPQGVPALHYSEDEQVIGTWIDGSTLYEKTYHQTSLSISANTELTIDDFTDKFPVSCCGVMHNSTDNRTYYPNWTYTSGNIYYRKNDSGNLVLRSESDSWGNTWEVFTTVRYIKSST